VTTETFAREGGSDLQTVLLVDAEVLSRLALADYLRECGYRVVEAASPEEAMMVLRAPELKVDILLSDGASQQSHEGFSLAHWTRQHCPGVEVLLAGNISRAAEMAGEVCEDGPQLAKPYEPQAVVNRIKRLKAARAAGT
jgi:DNA-binding NtrC family response regulator